MSFFEKQYEFSAVLWVWQGKGAWYFVTLPEDISQEIKDGYPFTGRGFGSVPVEVTIKDQVWNTSIFPDSKSGSYFLPIKKKVREAAEIGLDDKVEVGIKISF